MRQEIDSVIGQSRQPCIADRAGMHYTEAVLHETQRMGDLLPLAIPRLASRDTSLAGYSIPQVGPTYGAAAAGTLTLIVVVESSFDYLFA